MKTQCLQTNEMQHCLGKESALGGWGGGERVALIKSLIYQDKENAPRAQGCQVQLKSLSWYIFEKKCDTSHVEKVRKVVKMC